MNTKIEVVGIGSIKPDPNQPRIEFDDEEIRELASTYKIQGMIHVIEVDEKNVIILGERRWRAAKKIGLKEVRILRKLGLNTRTRLERQLIDDANRKDLNDMERAWAYATAIINLNLEAQRKEESFTIREVKKMKKSKLTNLLGSTGRTDINGGKKSGSSELSRRIGVPQMTINYLVNLLKLSDDFQKVIAEKSASKEKSVTAYGRAISRIEDESTRKELEKTVMKDLEKPRKERTFKIKDEVEDVVSLLEEPAKKIVEKDVLDVFTRSDLKDSEREEAQKRIKKVIEPKVKLTKGEKDDLVMGRKKPERLIHQKKEELIDDAVTDLIEQVPEDVLTEKEQEMRDHATKSRKEREESNKRLRESVLAQLKRKFFYSSGAHGAAISGIDKMFCPKCGEDSSNIKWTCCDITLPEAVKLHELAFGRLRELSDDEYKDSSEQEIRDKIKIGVDK